MAVDSQTLQNTKATVGGKTVYTSQTSVLTASSSNSLPALAINTGQINIINKEILVGFNVAVAGNNGTSASSASMSFTFDDTVESTSLAVNPYLQLTDAAGLTRTYIGLLTGTPGTATFTFDKAAILNETITIQAYFDGSLVSKTFQGKERETVAGTLSGANVTFAIDDSDSGGASDSAFDAAANLAAAINHTNGLSAYVEAYANQASATDPTLATGKVFLQTKDDTLLANTNITKSATAATSTFTCTDKPNDTSTITVIDSDGTSVTFEIDNEDNGVTGGNIAVNGIAAAGGGATGTAADLVAKINAQGSLDIVATNPSAGVVLLTQGTTGAAGNTSITVDDATHWNSVCSVNVSDFTGGVAFDDATSVAVPTEFTGATAPTLDISKNQWARSASKENVAEGIKDAINHAQGHGSSLTATRSGGTVTVTQDVSGPAGNTRVAFNTEFQNLCSSQPTNFTEGANASPVQLGVRYSTDGTNWTAPEVLISDLKANETGLKLTTFTAANAAPYVQFLANSSEVNWGATTGSFVFTN